MPPIRSIKKKEIQDKEAKENAGAYFVRTSLAARDEETVWKIYNTIKDIRSADEYL